MANVPLTSQSRSNAERQPRKFQKLYIWGVAYVFAVVIQGYFITGFSLGFTSPVLADFKEKEGYASLRKPIHQDLFNVRAVSYSQN